MVALTQASAMQALALAPDGQTLATAGKSGTVKLWRVKVP
jgi:WD40 repeat protein